MPPQPLADDCEQDLDVLCNEATRRVEMPESLHPDATQPVDLDELYDADLGEPTVVVQSFAPPPASLAEDPEATAPYPSVSDLPPAPSAPAVVDSAALSPVAAEPVAVSAESSAVSTVETFVTPAPKSAGSGRRAWLWPAACLAALVSGGWLHLWTARPAADPSSNAISASTASASTAPSAAPAPFADLVVEPLDVAGAKADERQRAYERALREPIEPRSGRLAVQHEGEQGRVYHRNRLLGTTPGVFALEPGEHRIVVEDADGRRHRRRVQVPREQTAFLRLAHD